MHKTDSMEMFQKFTFQQNSSYLWCGEIDSYRDRRDGVRRISENIDGKGLQFGSKGLEEP